MLIIKVKIISRSSKNQIINIQKDLIKIKIISITNILKKELINQLKYLITSS